MNSKSSAISSQTFSRKPLLATFLLTGLFLALGFASRARTNPHLAWTFCGVAAFMLVWQLALLLKSAGGKLEFGWEFKAMPSHYVQAMVHFSIYTYWGWYWRNVYAELPLIFAQLAFLYVLSGVFSWSRGEKWQLGFGPWPIIFSTNLFLWFRDDWYIFQFLMVAVGLLGKQFIRWKRNGKLTHIFNPSAFTLTLFSLVLISTGTTDHTWGEQIATTQGRPPHIYLEIFMCGMVVQYLFRVTLMTFSAAAMIGLLSLIYTHLTGVYFFFDSNIPIAVFLGLHLLMTDPATTPRSSIGRIIFGSLYGIGVVGSLPILDALGVPSFYDKLVIVPILNLLTPALEKLASLSLAGRFGRWEMSVNPRKLNVAFMSGWIALFLTMLCTGFVESPHPGATIGFWKKAAEEKRPHALDNLRVLLHDFTSQDLDDPTKLVGTAGGSGTHDRSRELGILCNQVATIYAEGKLVPADPAKASYYFSRSCEFGDPQGCLNLAIHYLVMNGTEPQEDVDKALTALEQSCAGDKPNAHNCYLVGLSYESGRGHPEDKIRARKYYEQAAGLGDIAACKSLAQMEIKGEGGAADHAAAASWFQKAADAKDGMSCLNLARLYHMGDGVVADEAKATEMLEKACSLGIQPACELLKQVKH